ncbi:hypothetical protein [Oceanibaculum nanhaiense]|jgi:hypothetical protein|uniref:hypothetical protein n=1 Tax=Oceanibaculum nanhaiense TaxID=1909734 RepID=UPI000A372C7E|nr:hypothetical protein [Oceanibaculum nanhaiense]MBC7137022.1 hypothetical protein [Oceanibaculum nanhaiense]
MLRIALMVLLPILTPTILYFLWFSHARRKAIAAGTPEAAPALGDAPWVYLAAFGVGFMVLVLGASALFFQDSGHPGDVYTPPKLIDGQIAPGHNDPAPPSR